MQPKGGSFTGDDKDFLRFKLGEHQVIPAFEEAVASMKVCAGLTGATKPGITLSLRQVPLSGAGLLSVVIASITRQLALPAQPNSTERICSASVVCSHFPPLEGRTCIYCARSTVWMVRSVSLHTVPFSRQHHTRLHR